ncbi:WD40 repeat domain-containing protein [Allofrancisella guangzhouensis]|uniref:Uncharacterized protein n=1 Tax=Allofrancisella guangzhouensis TaxID=594679 RepID=A0A0A8E2M8_9GAMM|nr:WD40 repeat domain-containing protein [Allofrancisella guangzhouensis]AJC48199.1 hypothetical protein SD28_00235 [Allofrancisella guangzhouensis]MBK2027066.1 WD40 repeat domain-containing protein [Allofrancisella guangzhouensis]MBK2044556.1 WD40 repeat domain-containing protein [Allofrancisella guangzhouensis]MBK2046112.1 WD40 repeat domain-containing protein [Allofrancisella guangzhouensis]
MTDYEFDIYWYNTLSNLLNVLITYEPADPSGLKKLFKKSEVLEKEKIYKHEYKKEIEGEITGLLYSIAPNMGSSNRFSESTKPTLAITKITALKDLLSKIRMEEKDHKGTFHYSGELEKIHHRIKTELRRLYYLYGYQLGLRNLSHVNTKSLISETFPSQFQFNNKKIPRNVLLIIFEYLGSSTYKSFRETCKQCYDKLPSLPYLPFSLPINYKNPICFKMKPDEYVTSVLMLPDERFIFGSSKGDITVIADINNFENRIILRGHFRQVTILKLLPLEDGSPIKIVSASDDGDICIWDLSNHSTNVRLRDNRDQSAITALKILSKGKALSGLPGAPIRIISGSQNGTINVWDLTNHNIPIGRKRSRISDEVTALLVSPDGRIVSGSVSGNIWIWEDFNCAREDTDRVVGGVNRFRDIITELKLLSDGRLLSASLPTKDLRRRSEDGFPMERITAGSIKVWPLNIWDVNNVGNVPPYILYNTNATILLICPDGRIVVGDGDGFVDIMRSGPGNSFEKIFSFKAASKSYEDSPVTDIKLLSDGRLITGTLNDAGIKEAFNNSPVARKIKVWKLDFSDFTLLQGRSPCWRSKFEISETGRIIDCSFRDKVVIW